MPELLATAASRLAGALDWVRSLPQGWDTPVGENGRELSGGQRQRIGVARALLTNAPVLVLDEPTAHLDRPTAEALVRDVLAAAGDRAVLLITHRSEGLDGMDDILELERMHAAWIALVKLPAQLSLAVAPGSPNIEPSSTVIGFDPLSVSEGGVVSTTLMVRVTSVAGCWLASLTL